MVNITPNFCLVLIVLDLPASHDIAACSVLKAGMITLSWISFFLPICLFSFVFFLLNDGILCCLVLSFLLPPGRCTCGFLLLENTPPLSLPFPGNGYSSSWLYLRFHFLQKISHIPTPPQLQ